MTGFRPSRPSSLAAIILLGLSGCGAVPFATQIKLRNFDPLTFDPATPRLAVFAPDLLRLSPGSAKITLVDGRAASGERREIFVLHEVREAEPALDKLRNDAERITRYRIAGADIARARALQAEFAARKAAGDNSRVEIKADIAACRLGPLPARDLKGSIHLMVDPASGYLPLMQSVDIRDLAKAAGTTLEVEVKPCPPGQK